MDDTRSAYHLPPDDYPAPVAACCERIPIFVPVVGGHKWVHLTANPNPEHGVVLSARWFDTFTGEWHEPDDVFVESPRGD